MANSTVEIVGSGTPFRVEEKRFYVEGVTLRSKCPHCGEVVDRDHYLSYPRANEPIDYHFGHEHRDPAGEYHDHEWNVRIVLRITIEPAP